MSMRRLSKFLDAEELQSDARIVFGPEQVKNGTPVLTIKDGDFRWTKKALVATLEDINLSIQKGELVGVLGRVGAGKVSARNVVTELINPDLSTL